MAITNSPVRILVVDDDALSRQVLTLLLQRENYLVDAADSGEEALRHLQKANVELPAIVLTDLQMPGLRGDELVHRLRETAAGASLIAMSASDPGYETLHVYDGFLLKPFTIDKLTALLSAARERGPAPAPEGDTPDPETILNETTFQKLSSSMRREQLIQLYTLCLGDAKKRIAEMRSAAAQGDDASYRREAHAVKGGCGMVGAIELQTLACNMESHGVTANYVASLDEFLLAVERLHRILFAREIFVGATTGRSGEGTYE